MRILAAFDSFKSAIDQVQVVDAVSRGLMNGYGEGVDVDRCPLADGGEGSSLLLKQQGGVEQPLRVADAYGQARQAHWVLWRNIALVESAQGSPYLPPHQRPLADPKGTTSRGTGQLIAAALDDSRVEEVWVGLGGTGSIDGGIGLLDALGYQFFDGKERRLPATIDAWRHVRRVKAALLSKPVVGLADVLVPLLGENGAMARFGPQKGLASQDIKNVEDSLAAFAHVVAPGAAVIPGAGAAGGMGFALHAAGARLESGAAWWAGWSDLDKRVAKADFVVTGEGRLDEQSLLGKVVSAVLESAQRHDKRVAVLAGQIPQDLEPFYRRGMWIALPIGSGAATLAEALAATEMRLEATAATLGRMLKAVSER